MQRAGTLVCLALGAGTFTLVQTAPASATMGWLGPREVSTDSDAQQQWLADTQTGCKALDSAFAAGDSIAWQGGCIGGLASGKGRLIIQNDSRTVETVSGTFWQGTLLPGNASASWSDGSSYEGGQSGGQFEGDGRFVSAKGDRIEGRWKGGALNGHAAMLWQNGDRYDGEWQDGKPDGQGLEVWANGDRYEGLWRNGKPLRTAAPAPAEPEAAGSASAAHAQASTAVVASSGPAAETARAADTIASSQVRAPSYPLREFVGVALVAVDGSRLALEQTEGGLDRTLTLQGGESQTISFAFINDRIGTVAEDTTPIGVFRADKNEIDIDYANGKTEVMKDQQGSGLRLNEHDPDGDTSCTAWYPEGHQFTQEEKQIAVQEYARRIGVSGSPLPKKRRVSVAGAPVCGGGFLTDVASAKDAPTVQDRADLAHKAPPAAMPSAGPQSRAAVELGAEPSPRAIPVREAPVHLIDAPFEPATGQVSVQPAKFAAETPVGEIAAGGTIADKALPANASECLSVGSDGSYWGFRNRCAQALQFSYCEMSESNPLTSCGHASASGSVSANGFSPLVSDNSLTEQNAKHEFRWMACPGGAGEVVAHLDSVEPPSGRCLRAVSAPAISREAAGS